MGGQNSWHVFPWQINQIWLHMITVLGSTLLEHHKCPPIMYGKYEKLRYTWTFSVGRQHVSPLTFHFIFHQYRYLAFCKDQTPGVNFIQNLEMRKLWQKWGRQIFVLFSANTVKGKVVTSWNHPKIFTLDRHIPTTKEDGLLLIWRSLVNGTKQTWHDRASLSETTQHPGCRLYRKIKVFTRETICRLKRKKKANVADEGVCLSHTGESNNGNSPIMQQLCVWARPSTKEPTQNSQGDEMWGSPTCLRWLSLIFTGGRPPSVCAGAPRCRLQVFSVCSKFTHTQYE